jgi:ppGpp synthetase/RelA/SpoT-type nucleotidyltranferase
MSMKISGSIENRFNVQRDHADAIQKMLSGSIRDWCKSKGWHFEDRIKGIESYAQKIEQSRITVVDDVYAATIIVRNKAEVPDCCQQLESQQNTLGIRFIKQVPESLTETNSYPEQFNFDSVRMYFKSPLPVIDIPEYVEEIFEIQIKTLLEQAWDKATHAAVYKSNSEVSWAKTRLISQIKALLESAELALTETELLSKSVVLQKNNPKFTIINHISNIYRATWDQAALPENMKLLAENTITFLDYIGKNVGWLEGLLKKECEAGRGCHLLNLSPYWIVVQATIIDISWATFIDILKANKKIRKNKKIPLLRELELPEMENISAEDPVYILK